MELHNFLTGLSKSLGLFIMLGVFIGAIVYAYWPKNRSAFDRSARSIIDQDDRPWQ